MPKPFRPGIGIVDWSAAVVHVPVCHAGSGAAALAASACGRRANPRLSIETTAANSGARIALYSDVKKSMTNNPPTTLI
jgi:hypothetical protein